MAWKFFSPNTKCKCCGQQIKDGVEGNGKNFSGSDVAYRKRHSRVVRNNNRLYAYKNATPEQRAAFKASRKTKKKCR